MRTKTTIVILTVCMLFSANAFAGIAGTAHDLSLESWNTQGYLCQACHTPHNASENEAAPLWGREMPTGYTADSLTTLKSTAWGNIAPLSLLCLSCHDGTIALDPTGGDDTRIDEEYRVGSGTSASLAGQHPISIDYDESLPDFKSEASVESAGLRIYAGSQVECGSCHDVHDDTNGSFLRISNGSALCLACHDK